MPVTAGTTYVASYHTTAGHYAATSSGLASAVTNGPLTALASGGVYAYGSSSTFPIKHLQRVELLGRRRLPAEGGSNPPTVTATTPGSAATSVPVRHRLTVTFNKADPAGLSDLLAHRPERERGRREHVAERDRDGADVHAVQSAQPRPRPTRRASAARPAPSASP